MEKEDGILPAGEEAHLTDDESGDHAAPTPAVTESSAEEEATTAKKLLTRRKSQKGGSKKEEKGKKIIVMKMDGTAIPIRCPQDKYTTTEEMLQVVNDTAKEKLDKDAAPLFGLWIVSASLQLQLKPHHLPFKIMKKWQEILESFAIGDTYDEVPGIYWKRDALVHQDVEKKATSANAIKLLYYELEFNLAYSFYPVELNDAITFAALALRIRKGDAAKQGDIKAVPACFLPKHLESKSWGWTWRKKVYKAYKAHPPAGGKNLTLRQEYLKLGRKFSFYGSTFFYGGLEHELPGRPDTMVRVGVNLDGVHVIDDDGNFIRLSLSYDEFTYNSYESQDDEDCFLIEYDADDGSGKAQMVIWSPQANMIDTLVTRHIEELDRWQESLKSRKARRQSYKPVNGAVRGRKAQEDGKSSTKYFTLSKASGGGAAAKAGGGGSGGSTAK